MIQANCRAQFTADDFSFVVRVLARSRGDAVSLVSLLSDEAERDAILDHELVYQSLVDDAGCLKVSAAFYFYVLTRRVLRRVSLDERALTDYVAAVLLAFSRTSQLAAPGLAPPATARSFVYVSDLMTQLATSTPEQAYLLHSHLGNYTLFLSGLFAERVESNAQLRGAPNLGFLRGGGDGLLPTRRAPPAVASRRFAPHLRTARARIPPRAPRAERSRRHAFSSPHASLAHHSAMTLLREIQLLLERTYAPVPINLEACLIGEARFAALNELAGPDAAHLAPSGRTFLRQAGDSLYVAIFYSRPLIAELEANDPRQALNERNISALITFIEEIAHGVQAALLFTEGERVIDSESYARNLEAQARIDTYLVLSRFAALLCGGRIPRRVGVWLRAQLFDQAWRRFESPRLQARYRETQQCALAFLRRLRRVPVDRRTDLLRRFRMLDWEEKVDYLKSKEFR